MRARRGLPDAEQRRARALAQIFIDEGAVEGVRGDMAFVQAVLETGGFIYPDFGQIRPEFNNYGGINAYDGRRKGTTCAEEVLDLPLASRCFPTPQIGVRAQHPPAAQLRRPDARRTCPTAFAMPPVGPHRARADLGVLRRRTARRGKLIWASAPTTACAIIQLVLRTRSCFNGARAECLPYFPGEQRPEVGQRLLGRRRATAACTRSAARSSTAAPAA